MFSGCADIKLELIILFVYVLFLLRKHIFNFREVDWMSQWAALKSFWWLWMNWDCLDLNCQTWSRYKKFLTWNVIWKHAELCLLLSLVMLNWTVGWINTSFVSILEIDSCFVFCHAMKENHWIIWLHYFCFMLWGYYLL